MVPKKSEYEEDTVVCESGHFCDIDHGEIYIFGDIDAAVAVSVVYAIRRLIEKAVKDLTIFISSPGGSAIHAFTIVEILLQARAVGMHIQTYAMGGCASGAADIFLCGHDRIMGKYCYFMMHSTQLTVLEAESVDLLVKEGKMWQDRNRDFLYDCLADTKIDYTYYKSKCTGKDWVIPPKEAVKLGIAHRLTVYKKEVSNGRRRKKTSKPVA